MPSQHFPDVFQIKLYSHLEHHSLDIENLEKRLNYDENYKLKQRKKPEILN